MNISATLVALSFFLFSVSADAETPISTWPPYGLETRTDVPDGPLTVEVQECNHAQHEVIDFVLQPVPTCSDCRSFSYPSNRCIMRQWDTGSYSFRWRCYSEHGVTRAFVQYYENLFCIGIPQFQRAYTTNRCEADTEHTNPASPSPFHYVTCVENE
eukprot:TRINITY_DN95741_c0_g1_i1.p1 TRINITY_DN95741_c0_g1~~TRINITY_DN95741_c0_g1_i1.p1  ORF type:complete len:167 (+),score=8.35 TRINITY_DN95741_c0_g1_i1:31-501(+)